MYTGLFATDDVLLSVCVTDANIGDVERLIRSSNASVNTALAMCDFCIFRTGADADTSCAADCVSAMYRAVCAREHPVMCWMYSRMSPLSSRDNVKYAN